VVWLCALVAAVRRKASSKLARHQLCNKACFILHICSGTSLQKPRPLQQLVQQAPISGCVLLPLLPQNHERSLKRKRDETSSNKAEQLRAALRRAHIYAKDDRLVSTLTNSEVLGVFPFKYAAKYMSNKREFFAKEARRQLGRQSVSPQPSHSSSSSVTTGGSSVPGQKELEAWEQKTCYNIEAVRMARNMFSHPPERQEEVAK
jgi:hypothetical protein